MAELRLTLDLRMPPDPSVVATIWAAAGIKVEPPEICRMLLLAQLAEPLDERGWQGAALIVGAALDAVAPEHHPEPEPEPEADDVAAFARMAEAIVKAAPPEVRFSVGQDGSLAAAAVEPDEDQAEGAAEPILIEDADASAPVTGGGHPGTRADG